MVKRWVWKVRFHQYDRKCLIAKTTTIALQPLSKAEHSMLLTRTEIFEEKSFMVSYLSSVRFAKNEPTSHKHSHGV